MYLKLTRLDNSPIWINAAFIVTIEPRKGGGATVVPVGDGLDYDVKESPETVLALLDGAPLPTVIPVPTKDALTPTPDDVSPETDTQLVSEARQSAKVETPMPVAEEKPVKKTRKTTSTATRKPRVSRKKKPELPLEAADVERLIRMRPKSLKKLQNTLQTQLRLMRLKLQLPLWPRMVSFRLNRNVLYGRRRIPREADAGE